MAGRLVLLRGPLGLALLVLFFLPPALALAHGCSPHTPTALLTKALCCVRMWVQPVEGQVLCPILRRWGDRKMERDPNRAEGQCGSYRESLRAGLSAGGLLLGPKWIIKAVWVPPVTRGDPPASSSCCLRPAGSPSSSNWESAHGQEPPWKSVGCRDGEEWTMSLRELGGHCNGPRPMHVKIWVR